jgi:hypothetical protein
LGDISNLTFLEFVELVQRKLVNAKSRKIITDFKGGYYPTLLSVYVEYLRRSCLEDGNPLKTNGYTFGNLYPFISKYNAFFERFVKQLLPATIILRKGGVLIRNTIFTKQKFTYKRGVSFDPALNWFGTDGSEFKYQLPALSAQWEDEFICEDDCDLGFVGTPSVLCDGSTTTTSTTTTSTTTTTTSTTTSTTTTEPVAETQFGNSGFFSLNSNNFRSTYYEGTIEISDYSSPINVTIDGNYLGGAGILYVSTDSNPSFIAKSWSSMGNGTIPQILNIDSASKPVYFWLYSGPNPGNNVTYNVDITAVSDGTIGTADTTNNMVGTTSGF